MTGSCVRVGMTASLTGRYSHPGSQALLGAKAWIRDTNRSGGVRVSNETPPIPVRLSYYDDESSVQRCGELVERLVVADEIDILLGPYSSGLALRAASVARRHERVLWNHGGALEAIHKAGAPWVVGILTPATRYFHGVIDMAIESLGGVRRAAIVSSTAGAFPREVALGATDHCSRRGIETVRSLRYGPNTSDFRVVLAELEAYGPDLLLAVGRIEDDIRFVHHLVRSGITIDTVGLIATPLALFWEELGRLAEGFCGPSQWEPGVTGVPDYGPSPKEIVYSLTAGRSTPFDYPLAQAYAGCLVAQRCIEMAESLDNSALIRAARELEFSTFYGSYKIDPASGRQVGHVMPVVRWMEGRKSVVWPLEMASPNPSARSAQ